MLEQWNNGVHGIFWNVLMFWQKVKLELLKLLKFQSRLPCGCFKWTVPQSPNQQTEVMDLSILAKSSLGIQSNLSGINCSVGIF